MAHAVQCVSDSTQYRRVWSTMQGHAQLLSIALAHLGPWIIIVYHAAPYILFGGLVKQF